MLSLSRLPVDEMCRAVFDGLAVYRGHAEQFDDMTLLVIEVN